MIALSEAIGKGALPQLQELYLSHNNIGDEGMKAFVHAIKGTDSFRPLLQLETLHLHNNQIGTVGMRALKTTLNENKHVLPSLAPTVFLTYAYS